MKKIIPFATIFLFGVYGVKLLLENKVGWYINKRYELFFATSAGICIVIGLIGIFLVSELFKKANNKHVLTETPVNHILFLIGYLPIVFTLVVGLFLPPKTLTASSTQSSQNFVYNTPKHYTPGEMIKELKLGADSKKYTFTDWLYIRSMDENFRFQKGKNVKLSGIVLKPEDTPEDIFFVARYMMTCCAVDLMPFGFPVQSDIWQTQLEENDWAEIEGQLMGIKRNNKDKLFIVPNVVKKIEEPSDPYLYY